MSGVVRWSRFLFNLVAWLFVACVAIQVYLAGLGVFGTGGFGLHAGFAAFGLLTIVMLILAIFGRAPAWVIGTPVLIFGLFVVQAFLAYARDTPNLAAFHTVNGFLIGLISIVVAWRTRDWLRAPRPTGTPESGTETKSA